MHATTENWQDIKKYFLYTFIVCPEVSTTQAFYVEDVGPSGIKIKTSDYEYGFIDLIAGGYEIQSPLLLQKQWCQHAGSALLLARCPARMWKKGIHGENTLASVLSDDGNILQMGLTWEIINEMLSQTYPNTYSNPVDLEKLCKGKSSVALSQAWALQCKERYLYLYNYVVGKVAAKKKTLNLIKELQGTPLPPALHEYEVTYV